MSRKDNLDQFDTLIDELQQAERPSTPNRTFKNKLRGRLLNQYEQSSFSVANLRRWAGTAVAFAVLALVVIYAWSIMARPVSTGAPVEVTRPAQPTEEPSIMPVDPESAVSSFREEPLLNRHQLSDTQVNPGDTLDVTLFWEGDAAPNTFVAVHLTDASGLLFSQADQPLTAEMNLTLAIPETLADGVYEVVVIKYDATTGAQQDSLLLQEIGVGTAVANPERAPNDVWLIAATQLARTSTTDLITLEITVGYQLSVDETVTLKPLYAHPDWETSGGSRLAVDGLGDEVELDGSSGTHTFIFSESAAVMREIVGTDQPVVMMQLSYLSEDANGNNRLNLLAMPAFTNFTVDLTSIDEIIYP